MTSKRGGGLTDNVFAGISTSRVYNVSVVGLTGSDATNSERAGADVITEGVGKSCLCNRFIRPAQDDYATDHISVLSQSDFGGRVVNNDHFLYWGSTTVTQDDIVPCLANPPATASGLLGSGVTFRVIEQTEFIDDSTFQPFKVGKSELYYKRCAVTRLSSAEKLMYICKNQLGLEHEFPQELLPEGRFEVDGFLCLFDISNSDTSMPGDRQLDYAGHILSQCVKTKKPVVFVTTKNDAACKQRIRDAEKLLSRKEFRSSPHGSIPLVETSALNNVNIAHAFITLAQLIERSSGGGSGSGGVKNKLKIQSYADGFRVHREICEKAMESYKLLIQNHVTNHRDLWIPTYQRLQSCTEYRQFVKLFGTDNAKQLFRQHVGQLRQRFLEQKNAVYLDRLKNVLEQILPNLDTIADRSWPSIMRWLERQDFWSRFFVAIPNGIPWRDSDLLESADERIPFDLLESSEAENVYRNHVNTLRLEQRRLERCQQFRKMLEENHNVGPGKSLASVAIFFLGRECFTALSEEDKATVYAEHQAELNERACCELRELLEERADLFARFYGNQVQSADISSLHIALSKDDRYQVMSHISGARDEIILEHLGFSQSMAQNCCPYREHCKETLALQVLSTRAPRPQSWNRDGEFLLGSDDTNRLNLVVFGANHLAEQLIAEVKTQCINDEYSLEDRVYCLNYRPISGDVSLPQNSPKSADFTPNGGLCVFNSLETLDYIRRSLEITLFTEQKSAKISHREKLVRTGERAPFHGLPIILILAHDPSVSELGLEGLRSEGQMLADKLQCQFIDIPSSMMVNTEKLFNEDQIALALSSLLNCIKHRSSFVQPWQIAESLEPDIRILICFMCGDVFDVQLLLGPLLDHQCCFVQSDSLPAITLESYLDESKRKVEVIIRSYHGGHLVRHELFHGLILVYSAKRQASLSTLSAFAETTASVPTKIMAVTGEEGPSVFYANNFSQHLITEGNKLADNLGAHFTLTPPSFRSQTAAYTPFFQECWERKFETESAFKFDEMSLVEPTHYSVTGPPPESVLQSMARRPPAALPKPPKRLDSFAVNTIKSNASQSTDGSAEPTYDNSCLNRCYSDSEIDRASITSPPTPPIYDIPYCGAGYALDDDSVYSEIPANITPERSDSTEHLVKPSMLKNKKNVNAGFANGKLQYRPSEFAGNPDSSKTSPKVPPRMKPVPTPRLTTRTAEHKGMVHEGRNRIAAPLARPENLDFSDYAQVRDAVPVCHENEYSLVHNALPTGHVRRIRCSLPNAHDVKDSISDGSDGTSDEILRSPRGGAYHLQKLNYSNLNDQCSADPNNQLLNKNAYWDEERDEASESWFKKEKRKEEKRIKDEKKKLKEEEKRQKKIERIQKKLEKREGKRAEAGVVPVAAPHTITLDDCKQSNEKLIPLFVEKCVEFIEEEGLTVEGIYRVPGNKAHVDLLMEKFEEDPNVDIRGLEIPVNAVATALKGFFSGLSEAVFPCGMHDSLIQSVTTVSDPHQRLRDLSVSLKQHKPVNYETLRYLIFHLNKVSEHSAENSMTQRNLAICWWPTLIRPEFKDFESMNSVSGHLEELVYQILENYTFFFQHESVV